MSSTPEHPPLSDQPMPEELEPASEAPDRNPALDLVRVTEAAAMAAARWVGRGDKNGADGVAVKCHARVTPHRPLAASAVNSSGVYCGASPGIQRPPVKFARVVVRRSADSGLCEPA